VKASPGANADTFHKKDVAEDNDDAEALSQWRSTVTFTCLSLPRAADDILKETDLVYYEVVA